jgi:hypothetical protein
MSTTDERINSRHSDLAAKRAAIPDDDSLSASTTRAELALIQQQRRDADRDLAQFNKAVAAVATLGTAEDDARWRDQLIAFRAALQSDLLAQKPVIRDPHRLGVAKNLTLSIEAIDYGPQVFAGTGWSLENSRLGALLIAAGYVMVDADPSSNYVGRLPWFGSLREVEKRITDLATQRAQAEANLEAALLTDEERAQQEAESKQLRDAMNNMVITNSIDGRSLTAYRNHAAMINNEVYAVEDMTEVERRAFTAADTEHRRWQAERLATALAR